MKEHNSRRVRRALEACAEALEFAAVQAGQGGWRWVAIAGCIALQGALVAALSGYETAQPEDVAHPEDGERVASIQTLLRRATSPDHLADPERLSGLAGARRQALELVELRNRAVHVSLSGEPVSMDEVRVLLPGLVALIGHLVIDHPAFPPADAAGQSRRIAISLQRLSEAIC